MLFSQGRFRTMINEQTLGGRWHEMRGKLKEKWGKLTDDDLRTFNGNAEQLVGRIQRRTGEAREVIENYLDDLSNEAAGAVTAVSERISSMADQAVDGVNEGVESIRHGYAEAERVVQERPGQSVAVAFGLGIISGLGLALVLRRRNEASECRTTERLGHQFRDTLSGMMPDMFKNMRG
jgi:uncharacterized protein YjbJ (UPF0337 family)